MKARFLILFAASFAAAVNMHSAVLINERFNYSDGVLTDVSDGTWSRHSGTAGQVDVQSGRVNLTEAEGEDVNTPIAGAPYSNTVLYAGFVVNFSGLPSGDGAFFWHFNTSNFRGRIFATTNGAVSGSVRVGIANGAATPSAVIPFDMFLDTDYTLVTRYDPGTGETTLWIDPASESSTDNRADATDSASFVPIATVGLRQSTSSGDGMGVLKIDDLIVATQFDEVIGGGDPTQNPPSLSSIADQTGPAGVPIGPIAFTVTDGETPAADLMLMANSANPTLVPNENIEFGGSGTDRTVTIAPVPGQQGEANITITVRDEHGNTATRVFTVLIGQPEISDIPDQFTRINTPTDPIPFTVVDHESSPESLVVRGESSNDALVPDANIVISGSGSNRLVTITPVSDQTGVVAITVIVNDGTGEASTTFDLSVSPDLGLDFCETFDYPDGPLVNASGSTWTAHSGNTGETQVASSQLHLTGAQGEDVSRFLNHAPYAGNSGAILYFAFDVRFTELPHAEAYFTHLRDQNIGFRARVFAGTNAAAPGSFRLGIANGAGSASAWFPQDLSLNTTYTAVVRYIVHSASTVLWVNPSAESSPAAAATDQASAISISTHAFRQAAGIGALTVDNLTVGTGFEDVLESPVRLQISKAGNDVTVCWPAGAEDYVLQETGSLPAAGWTDVIQMPAEMNGLKCVTFPNVSGMRLFRLIHRP